MNLVNSLLLVSLLLPVTAWGLSSDKNKPIQIEADRLEIDDNKNISEYSGNVRLIQGSLNVTADRIKLHFDAEQNLQWLRIEGNPAHFKQLTDDNKPVNASAQIMDYFESDSRLEMRGEARVETGEDLIESENITLNTSNDTVEAGDPQGNNRVRMVIQPKNSSNE